MVVAGFAHSGLPGARVKERRGRRSTWTVVVVVVVVVKNTK